MHVEVAREVVGVGFGQAGPADDPGVVDEDVDAPEPFDRGIDERLRAGRIRDVVGVGNRNAIGIVDLGRDDGRGFGVGAFPLHRSAEVVDHDTGAPAGEQAGIRTADAASGARDHRNAPIEAVLVHRPILTGEVPSG